MRSDRELGHDVEQELEADVSVGIVTLGGEVSSLVVEVDHGWVTLSGQVTYAYQRRAAEEGVRYLMGVHGVSKLITSGPTPRRRNGRSGSRMPSPIRPRSMRARSA